MSTRELRQHCEREKQRLLSETEKLRTMISNEDYDAASRLAGNLDLWLANLRYDSNRLADKE